MLNAKEATFGERVSALLTSLMMTQQELAWLLGISNVTISRWVTGDKEPSTLTDMVIATVERAVKAGKGRALAEAVRKKTIRGGTPEALSFITTLAFPRGNR